MFGCYTLLFVLESSEREVKTQDSVGINQEIHKERCIDVPLLITLIPIHTLIHAEVQNG